MRISGVQAQLNGEDILSIINEFVKVEGLELTEVNIDKSVTIKGSFKKGITIDFNAELLIEKVEDNKIFCRLSKVKVMSLGIFRMVRSLALKIALKELKVNGIENEKDMLIIDIDKIISTIPYVRLKIKDIYMKGNLLNVEVEDVNISIKGEFKEEQEVAEEIVEEKVEVEEVPINKVEDGYTIGRKTVEEKMPEKMKKVSDYIFVIPDIIALIYRLLKDNRVAVKTKLIISASLAYVISPRNIIPNNIPFIGRIDDVAVVFFALNRIANDVEANIIVENWEGKNELVVVLKTGLDYIVNFTNANNVEKLYNIVEEISTL